MITDGWIKLHRDILDKPVWLNSTPEQKSILITLLLMANHNEKKWEWKGKPYHCEAGEFISSYQKIAGKSGKGISIQNVRTALKRFEKLQFLTVESTGSFNGGIKVLVTNWEIYQNKTNSQSNRNLTGTQQEPNRKLTTNKNERNKETNNLSKDKLCQIPSDENKQKVDLKITPYQEIANLFNNTCSSLPKIKSLSKSRKDKLRCRWKENPDLSFWEEIFRKVEDSDFLTGRSGNWHNCSFDWIITNNTNYLKILEGNYDNTRGENNGTKEAEDLYDIRRYIEPPLSQEEIDRELSEVWPE